MIAASILTNDTRRTSIALQVDQCGVLSSNSIRFPTTCESRPSGVRRRIARAFLSLDRAAWFVEESPTYGAIEVTFCVRRNNLRVDLTALRCRRELL